MGNFWTDTNGTATGNRLGGIEGTVNENGDNKMGIRAYRYSNGNSSYNQLAVGIKSDGTNYYEVTNAGAFRAAIDAVCLSGDTMTNSLNFSSSIDLTTRPSNDMGITRIQYLDANGNVMGGIRETHSSNDGTVYNKIITRRVINSNTTKVCELGSGIKENGDYTYIITSPEAFRTAIGMTWTSRTATVHSDGNINSNDFSYTYQRNDALGLVYIQFSATIAKAITAHKIAAAISINSNDIPEKWAIGSGIAVSSGTYYNCKIIKATGNTVLAIGGVPEALSVGATVYGEIMWRI